MYYGRPSLPDFGCEPALRAYADAGMRTAFGLVSRDQNIYAHESDEVFLSRLPAGLAEEVRRSPMGYAWPVDEVMASFERLSGAWHGHGGRIAIVTAPDWTPACSDDLYVRCRRAADEHGTQMITHVLETRSEMLFSLHEYGKTAVRRLADLGVLTPATVCEHFVWVTDDELLIFADSGAVASNNPGSNLRLSTGICRARDIMDAGGRVAFGTDGISFSDREDFFAELRLAAYLQRLPREFGQGRLGSERLLRAAAANGARALGMEGKLGSLEPGKYADLLVVAKDRIFFPPGRYDTEPFLDVVLDRADAGDIDTVMAHGQVLMEGGRSPWWTRTGPRRFRGRGRGVWTYRPPRCGVAELRHPGRAVPAADPGDRPHRARLYLQPRTPPAAPGRRRGRPFPRRPPRAPTAASLRGIP
jgi:5-methylthioadenosine/S-adenosylhomocysteine deaminase